MNFVSNFQWYGILVSYCLYRSQWPCSPWWPLDKSSKITQVILSTHIAHIITSDELLQIYSTISILWALSLIFNFPCMIPKSPPSGKVDYFLSFKTIFWSNHLGCPCGASSFANYTQTSTSQDHDVKHYFLKTVFWSNHKDDLYSTGPLSCCIQRIHFKIWKTDLGIINNLAIADLKPLKCQSQTLSLIPPSDRHPSLTCH